MPVCVDPVVGGCSSDALLLDLDRDEVRIEPLPALPNCVADLATQLAAWLGAIAAMAVLTTVVVVVVVGVAATVVAATSTVPASLRWRRTTTAATIVATSTVVAAAAVAAAWAVMTTSW